MTYGELLAYLMAMSHTELNLPVAVFDPKEIEFKKVSSLNYGHQHLGSLSYPFLQLINTSR